MKNKVRIYCISRADCAAYYLAAGGNVTAPLDGPDSSANAQFPTCCGRLLWAMVDKKAAPYESSDV